MSINNSYSGYHLVLAVCKDIYRHDFVETSRQLYKVAITPLLSRGKDMEAQTSGPAAVFEGAEQDPPTRLWELGAQALPTTLQSV